MPAAVIFHAWLWGRETDQRLGHKFGSRTLLGWTTLNVPRTGCIDAQHRDGRRLDLRDDGWERFPEGTPEGEPEDGVDEEVSGFESLSEVWNERDG